MEEKTVQYESLEEERREALNKEFLEKYPKYEKISGKKKSSSKRAVPIILSAIIMIVGEIILFIGCFRMSNGDSSAYELLFYYGIPLTVAGVLALWVILIGFFYRSRLKVKREIAFTDFLREKGISYRPKILMKNMTSMMNEIKNRSRQ